MIPYYKIHITEEGEGMDFIALVDVPAHMKSFEYFNENDKPVRMFFNEERRIVTGVAIATDLPIYRNSPDVGEHYVIFDKQDTFRIAQNMMEKGFLHNVNEMHDDKKKLDGVYLVESYFIDRARGVNEPDSFKNQNLKDGSWITSYYVKNDKVWQDIKKGKFFGFSIEGWFDKTPINITQTKKEEQMSKENKDLLSKIKALFSDADNTEAKTEEVFGEAVTVEGVAVVWDGEELVEGIELRVVTEEGEVLAPDGEHAIEVGDEIMVVVTEGGIINDILEGEAEEVAEEVADEEMSTDDEDFKFDEIIVEFSKEVNNKINKNEEAYKSEIKELKETIEDLRNDFKAIVDATEGTKRKFNKVTPEPTKKAVTWRKYSK